MQKIPWYIEFSKHRSKAAKQVISRVGLVDKYYVWSFWGKTLPVVHIFCFLIMCWYSGISTLIGLSRTQDSYCLLKFFRVRWSHQSKSLGKNISGRHSLLNLITAKIFSCGLISIQSTSCKKVSLGANTCICFGQYENLYLPGSCWNWIAGI